MRKETFIRIFTIAAGLLLIAAAIVLAVRNSAAGTREKTFFTQYVAAGGPIVWFVLLPMSVITVYLAVDFFLTIRKTTLLPDDIAADTIAILRSQGYRETLAKMAQQKDMLSKAFLAAAPHPLDDRQPARTRLLVAESLQEQTLALMRKIEWCNIIGNVAPMVGLFGTVLGMINAFNGIVIAGGQPQPAQLAGGISVALVTTFWGLLIAIPALAVHGIFRNRIESIAGQAAADADALIRQIAILLKQRRQPSTEKRQISPSKPPDIKVPIKTIQSSNAGNV
ncbi:MAG: MotA/TolQ/ExbB proton channel family protein [Planctomycetota bacterium]